MKALVMGFSGSGKSYFSKKLSEIYGVSPLHLDALLLDSNFEPHHIDKSNEIKNVINQDNFVIDGVYKNYQLEERLEAADHIFIFMLSPIRCLKNVNRRRMMYKHRIRDDAPVGSKEKFSLSFTKWVLFECRGKERMSLYSDICKNYKDKVIIFKTRNEVEAYLDGLKEKN